MAAAASLAPLLALAGHCFAGDVAPATRDTHCFTSLFDGSHVRDAHQVTKDGRTIYQGESIYSVEGGAVAFTYWSSIGGIGHGTATFAPNDWHFTLAMRATPDAAPMPLAIRWQWRGADAYVVSGGPAAVTFRRVN
jgi:hypothetical protein